MISVLIVEDDPMVAEINKNYLESIEGFICVGLASDTNEALDLMAKNQVEPVLRIHS